MIRACLAALMLVAVPAAAQDVAHAPGEIEAKVYFEWDSTQASAEFARVLDEVADKLKARGWRSVTLEGHTDESHTHEYALALSERWANSVKRDLEARGIAAEAITVIAYGRTRPALASQPRELLNRRVEIRIDWE